MKNKKESKEINNQEYLKMALRDFFEELKLLLEAKVSITHSYKGMTQKLISVKPLEFVYELEDGAKNLKEKKWDELDFILFRRSFFLDDGFIV